MKIEARCGLVVLGVLLAAGGVFSAGGHVSTVIGPPAMDQSMRLVQQDLLYQRLVTEQAEVGIVDLGPLNADERALLEAAGSRDLRRQLVGVDRPLELSVDLALSGISGTRGLAAGAVRTLIDGSLVWTANIRSEGATALRAHLTDISLPAGARLWVYGAQGDAFGPYTGQGQLGRNEIWTNTVLGDTIHLQLEINTPVRLRQKLQSYFVVNSIGHMGESFQIARWQDASKSFCDGPSGPVNASCIENAECASMPGTIAAAQHAIASMLFKSGGSYYLCTGGLVADAGGSMTPYFLTANHCISKGNEASSLETYWDFTVPCHTSSCGYAWDSGRATPGASLLKGSKTGDYTLLELAAIPGGRTFLGWDATPVASANGTKLYRISHPSGAPQAYSQQTVDTGAGTCRSWPRGSWIYSRDTFGATEGGSSGSPVLNGSGEIVGQLSGGCGTNLSDVCDANNNATVDGAFASYYSSVSQWLDGGSGGCIPSPEVCDGVDNDCNGIIDDGDVCGGGGCNLGQVGDSCSGNSDCCSNKCRGKSGSKVCR